MRRWASIDSAGSGRAKCEKPRLIPINCLCINALFRHCLAIFLECVSKIPEYAISGVAAPFLRHKARLSAAKPSDLFLELTKNPLELADFPF